MMPRCNECDCDETFWEIVENYPLDSEQEELVLFLECPDCGEQLERKYRYIPRILTTLASGRRVWIDA